jgi:uncharacterized protein (TIGR02444 family)
MTNASHKFWDFSLDIYQVPEVAQACLDLQNTYGLDVNLVLLCCWYGAAYGTLPAARLEQACQHSSKWRKNLVQPLRNARTWMKSTGAEGVAETSEFDALRQQIKQAELAAEKMQQHTLEKMVLELPLPSGRSRAKAAIQANFEGLLALTGTHASPALNQMLAILSEASAGKALN